jgi:hypothetical protein
MVLKNNGYKCYHPLAKRFYVTMDITFFEDACYFSSTDPSFRGDNHSYLEEKVSEIIINGVSQKIDLDKLITTYAKTKKNCSFS